MNNDEEIKIEGGIDINQALKEFEAKSSAETAQAAPKVSNGAEISDLPTMVRWVIKLSGGAVKEQRTAEYILLGFAIAVVCIALFIFFDLGNKIWGPAPAQFEQFQY